MEIEFAPRELCENIQAMGCKSESGFYWTQTKDRYELLNKSDAWNLAYWRDGLDKINLEIMAFIQNDFTGATKQAQENCKIVWHSTLLRVESKEFEGSLYGEGFTVGFMTGPSFKIHPYMMIRCHVTTEEFWWQYIQRTMKK